jgi:hypothetical protein
MKNIGVGCTLIEGLPSFPKMSLEPTKRSSKKKETGDKSPPVSFYDGATPTKKSIVAWAAAAAQSTNAASYEGAVRLAGAPPARNFRNWDKTPGQHSGRRDAPATNALARNILD